MSEETQPNGDVLVTLPFGLQYIKTVFMPVKRAQFMELYTRYYKLQKLYTYFKNNGVLQNNDNGKFKMLILAMIPVKLYKSSEISFKYEGQINQVEDACQIVYLFNRIMFIPSIMKVLSGEVQMSNISEKIENKITNNSKYKWYEFFNFDGWYAGDADPNSPKPKGLQHNIQNLLQPDEIVTLFSDTNKQLPDTGTLMSLFNFTPKQIIFYYYYIIQWNLDELSEVFYRDWLNKAALAAMCWCNISVYKNYKLIEQKGQGIISQSEYEESEKQPGFSFEDLNLPEGQ